MVEKMKGVSVCLLVVLVVVLVCALAASVVVAAPVTESSSSSSNSSRRRRHAESFTAQECAARGAKVSSDNAHCVCETGWTCVGSACEHGTTDAQQRVSGWLLRACTDCVCTSPEDDQRGDTAASASSSSSSSSSSSFTRTENQQTSLQMSMEEVDRLTAPVDWRSAMLPVAFLKFHKVGSTTVSLVLERLAELSGKKLCGRAEAFFDSLPCQVWTTHDTELVMGVGGAHGLRFFVGSHAVAVTVMRNPIDRLMSRYYYDKVLEGDSTNTIPSHSELRQWLDDNEQEKDHYTRVLSRGTMDVEDAKEELKDIDVVGVTDKMDELLVLLAFRMRVPLQHLTYKRQKVVEGRPRMNQLPPDLLALLEQSCLRDMELYRAAQTMNRAAIDKIPEFEKARSVFASLQARVDQKCTYSQTDSKVLTGLDCYKLA
ncbi:hypothetical protein PTSG_09025 [Salpingoeca rosetta]|uniref:Sulfotransferase domain-containing protein n=1 Tax=Salpingoeca rosetta (strain ATCC 50818 / BSB-021) TaxID=946362 RepID=F2UM00_SALR5|nr:uncharacterized protein PTSG_09025 [Salpingoeca rosetta]EGD78149.1 hypothetical protein PTSG_09025 [Salpingoeca rosetta]|eukprot:XP_004989825.1 hypothetical protein PTSG_09025 [Salpingoeca rosetta]